MKIIKFNGPLSNEMCDIIDNNNITVTCIDSDVCFSSDSDANKLQYLAPEGDYVVSDLTLEVFRDLINDALDWNNVFNTIIDNSNWQDETNTQFGICKDRNRRLEFNSKMEAVINDIDI